MTLPLSPKSVSPKTAEDANRVHWPDFPYTISRSFEGPGDQELEVAIEVKHYKPLGDNGSLDHRDPNYDSGYLEFGDAFVVPSGNPITLTRLEEEAAIDSFWRRMN